MTDTGRLLTDGSVSGRWLRRGIANLRAAYSEYNSGEAAYHLGELYRIGHGAPESADVALAWYRRADDLGWDPASVRLKRLGRNK